MEPHGTSWCGRWIGLRQRKRRCERAKRNGNRGYLLEEKRDGKVGVLVLGPTTRTVRPPGALPSLQVAKTLSVYSGRLGSKREARARLCRWQRGEDRVCRFLAFRDAPLVKFLPLSRLMAQATKELRKEKGGLERRLVLFFSETDEKRQTTGRLGLCYACMRGAPCL